jgi:hypothetical protein
MPIAWAKAQPHPEVRDRTIWEMFEAERASLVAYAGPFDGFHAVLASSLREPPPGGLKAARLGEARGADVFSSVPAGITGVPGGAGGCPRRPDCFLSSPWVGNARRGITRREVSFQCLPPAPGRFLATQ